MEQVGLAIVGSTGVIGKTHIEAIAQLSSCRLAVSYTHLTLPTTPYV